MALSGNIYHEISKIWRVSIFLLVIEKQFKTKDIAGLKLGQKGSKGYFTTQQNTEKIEFLNNKR
jgi:putative transposase